MSKVLTDQQNYVDIANAIRNKNGTTNTYKPSEMAEAINQISGGGTQAQLNAPSILLNKHTLELTNPTTNGNFADGFHVYNGENLIATMSIENTTLDLSTIFTEEGSYTINAKCYGLNMTESDASENVVYEIIPISTDNYISFESEDGLEFTLATKNATTNWAGTLEYSTNTSDWSTWDGTTINSSSGKLYLRGTENSKITSSSKDARLVLGGSATAIQCNGDIRNLLDYTKVANGESPSMGAYCFGYMFYNCSKLSKAPELPATNLSINCYYYMFYGCSNLTTAPELPATSLRNWCYGYMFQGCTKLTTLPKLPATNVMYGCYNQMFYGCSKIKVSASQTDEYKYEWRIPTEGTGSEYYATTWGTLMFSGTGGTFTSTPSINTTYYTTEESI